MLVFMINENAGIAAGADQRGAVSTDRSSKAEPVNL